jgi:hypothetical protein
MKVVFSKGNLQADRQSTTAAWGWKFADNQYDFYGENNRNSTFSGGVDLTKRDLFSWSNIYTNMGLDDVEDDDELDDATFIDWGSKYIQGDPGSPTNVVTPWFTLSYDEWAYLIGPENMSASTNCRPNAQTLRARAKITGISGHPSGSSATEIYGFLLFPDNWSAPADVNLTYGCSNGTNVIDLNTWSRLEAAGAMFLPAAGYTDTYFQVQNTYETGYYWSCSPTTGYGDEVYNLSYNYTDAYANMSWQVGQSQYVPYNYSQAVRLVKPAPGYSMSDRESKK